MTKEAFVKKLAKHNVKLAAPFLSAFLEDISLNPSDKSPEALLVYKYLLDVAEIFEHTPSLLRGEGNDSHAL